MKKWYGILLMALLCMLSSMTVFAKGVDKTVVALGGDLTAEQRKTVLEYMNLSEADLADCVVITITNEMEHAYLDSYMDPAVIGTKSLSSVKLEPAKSGNGVLVNSYNINYCTTGMYRNALLTAGLEDTNVTVVGPIPLSGTAALIGAIKGYEEISGKNIPDSTLDTAMDELITTGEIAQGDNNSDEVEALVAFLKAKLANGELQSEKDIRDAIAEGEKKFDVNLSEDEIQKIIDILGKIDKLGLDLGSLIDQAQDLYDKYGMDIVNKPDEVVSEVAKQQVTNIFTNLKNKVTGFFTKLFKK